METNTSLAVTKKSMTDFVHDMAKIELDEFTLRKTAEVLRRNASNEISSKENELSKLKKKRDALECELNIETEKSNTGYIKKMN